MITLETDTPYPSAGSAWQARAMSTSGRSTTVHVATYPSAHTRVELVLLDPPEPLQAWARDAGVSEAVNGGFFTKPEFHPLGELVLGGVMRVARPFQEPWAQTRGCLWLRDGELAIGPRDAAPGLDPDVHLLQAGPLLVHRGEAVVAQEDPEGFATTCSEFDSDITDGPYPRMAIGRNATTLFAVSVDGRSDDDDGLDLVELAHLLVELGATEALNLDGGSSSSLLTEGVRRNNPRDDTGAVLEGGYPTATALAFRGRG